MRTTKTFVIFAIIEMVLAAIALICDCMVCGIAFFVLLALYIGVCNEESLES